MFNKLVVYRPTPAALTSHRSSEGKPLPSRIHVHAERGVVACYEGHADVHFATINGVFDKHGLGWRDLEQIP